jgi:SNW domain-containing protein 1
VSAKDSADWKIPPCISNWKNAKGYTIPLDKRLAADGRGLTEVQINDNFAKLSEALYVAESKAREAVETRAKITRELLAKEKDRKEDELRQLAQAARMARGGITAGGAAGGGGALPPPPPLGGERLPPPPPLPAGMSRPRAMEYDGAGDGERLPPPPPGPPPSRHHGGGGGGGYGSDGGDSPPRTAADDAPREGESAAEREARRRRDEIREERRRERERERRLEARDAHGGKRSKVTRDRERDVSERVALGQANLGGAGGRGGEALYDQRLFNQDAGLGSGFGADDGYNTFSKPLFADKGNSLYAPGRSAGADGGGAAGADAEAYGGEGAEGDAVQTGRFKPDRGFAGAEGGTAGGAGGGRVGGPVAFERPPEDEDPFGLGQFLTDVRRGGGKDAAPTQGRPGAMAAAAGGGDASAGGSSRSRVDFQPGGR